MSRKARGPAGGGLFSRSWSLVKPGSSGLVLGFFEVHSPGGHVQVAAVYHGLSVQFHREAPQVHSSPLHPLSSRFACVPSVGGIAAHQIELRVFRGDDPALVAVNVIAEARTPKAAQVPAVRELARNFSATKSLVIALSSTACRLRRCSRAYLYSRKPLVGHDTVGRRSGCFFIHKIAHMIKKQANRRRG